MSRPGGDGPVDAIVIGSGPNGLAAAITLARAGRSVRVYEAAATAGGGTRTAELTLPGFRHDVCSTILPLTLASPFFASVDLRARDVDLIQPDAPVAHPLDGGQCGHARTIRVGHRGSAGGRRWASLATAVRTARARRRVARSGDAPAGHPPAATSARARPVRAAGAAVGTRAGQGPVPRRIGPCVVRGRRPPIRCFASIAR